MKEYLEDWYSSNMSSYDKFIANTRYCNDTMVSSNKPNSQYRSIEYTSLDRIGNPSFMCENTMQTYGGEYDLKIGLLTADEANFAGMINGPSSSNIFLGQNYIDSYMITMTPGYIGTSNYDQYMWGYGDGSHDYTFGSNTPTNEIKPVINLKADILYTEGNGQKDTPYIIK